MPRSQPRTCSRCRPGMAEWLERLYCHLGFGLQTDSCVHASSVHPGVRLDAPNVPSGVLRLLCSPIGVACKHQ